MTGLHTLGLLTGQLALYLLDKSGVVTPSQVVDPSEPIVQVYTSPKTLILPVKLGPNLLVGAIFLISRSPLTLPLPLGGGRKLRFICRPYNWRPPNLEMSQS